MTPATSRSYCTMFDRRYLLRGVAMCESLREAGERAPVWVLCLDDESERALERLRLPGVHAVPISTLLHADGDLAAVKGTRSRAEFIFACTAAWTSYVMRADRNAPSVTYLDADLFFFSSPDPLYAEAGQSSVIITPHRFPAHARALERYGIYNVGLVHFRRDPVGQACLARWRGQCIEWSGDRAEAGRFADQKYLDEWPRLYDGVHVASNRAANVAPWNWCESDLGIVRGRLRAGDSQLIFYHFHGFRALTPWLFDTGPSVCGPMPADLKQALYGGYAAALQRLARRLEPTVGQLTLAGSGRRRLDLAEVVRLVAGRRLMMSRQLRAEGSPA